MMVLRGRTSEPRPGHVHGRLLGCFAGVLPSGERYSQGFPALRCQRMYRERCRQGLHWAGVGNPGGPGRNAGVAWVLVWVLVQGFLSKPRSHRVGMMNFRDTAKVGRALLIGLGASVKYRLKLGPQQALSPQFDGGR